LGDDKRPPSTYDENMNPTTYNLWLSEDTRYTLGFRMGTRAEPMTVAESEAHSQTMPATPQPDHVDLLIERLSRRYEP
jgi:hypothetical protein